MTNRKLFLVGVAFLPFLAGCTEHTALRYDGVSPAAGDAIAANTVMQMVDPWPAGVEQTDLNIPADHDQYRKAEAVEEGGDSVSVVAD